MFFGDAKIRNCAVHGKVSHKLQADFILLDNA